MYGQEILQQKNFMRKWECGQKKDRWNTYWILKYQNWNTAESEADPPMSCINERAIRYADVLLLLAESYCVEAGFADGNRVFESDS